MANCWPPCSYATCYPTACTLSNTLAYSTEANILRVRRNGQPSGAQNQLSYAVEYSTDSSGWVQLSDAQLIADSSGCLVQVRLSGSSAAPSCGTATSVALGATQPIGEQSFVLKCLMFRVPENQFPCSQIMNFEILNVFGR